MDGVFKMITMVRVRSGVEEVCLWLREETVSYEEILGLLSKLGYLPRLAYFPSLRCMSGVGKSPSTEK